MHRVCGARFTLETSRTASRVLFWVSLRHRFAWPEGRFDPGGPGAKSRSSITCKHIDLGAQVYRLGVKRPVYISPMQSRVAHLRRGITVRELVLRRARLSHDRTQSTGGGFVCHTLRCLTGFDRRKQTVLQSHGLRRGRTKARRAPSSLSAIVKGDCARNTPFRLRPAGSSGIHAFLQGDGTTHLPIGALPHPTTAQLLSALSHLLDG